MKRPRVMTPMGPLHLPVPVDHPTEGRCWSYANGEYKKFAAVLDGIDGLRGTHLGSGGNAELLARLIGPMPEKPIPDTSGRVLTMPGVARLLGIPSPREARKYLKRNGLEPVKVGRKFFIEKATVEDFIIAQQKAPTPAAVYAKARTSAGDRAEATLAAVDRLDASRKSRVQA